MKLLLTIFILLLLIFSYLQLYSIKQVKPKYQLTYKSTITSSKHPSFLQIHEQNGQKSLYVTQFTGNPLQSGYVQRITNIESGQNNFHQFNYKFKWPNLMTFSEGSVLGFTQSEEVMLVSDGFLVPGKSTGNIYVVLDLNKANSKVLNLNKFREGYFYHMTQIIDMNNDGKMDILTACVNFPISGQSKGILLWLEQPKDSYEDIWQEHIIGDMGEVEFISRQNKENKKHLEIYCANFFTNTLTLTLFDTNTASLLWSRVIDQVEAAYDVTFAKFNFELDDDQLMLTNHVEKTGGNIVAYEIPKDLQNGEFKKFIISENQFLVTKKGQHEAAPGFAWAIYPDQSNQNGRPSIIVAGDGSQNCVYLEPQGNSPYDYAIVQDIEMGGVVGYLGIGNVEKGNNYLDVYIPNYDKGIIDLYSFEEAN